LKQVNRRSFIEISSLAIAAYGGKVATFGLQSEKRALDFLCSLAQSKGTPDRFYHWSFGGQPYANPVQAQSMDFRFWFTPAADHRLYSFRDEVFAACRELDKKRAGKPVALCYSGGVDSEVIATAMHQLGIPFELYFLDFWGLNRDVHEQWAKPLAAKWGKEVNVVSLNREFFLQEYATSTFAQLGCESPTYLGLTYLFSQIPADRFIVTGDGDLDRQGSLFSHIGQHVGQGPIESLGSIAFSANSVVYENWAAIHQRTGAFYFYRSTPGLVAAAISDPLFQASYPFSNTKKLVHAAFPEVQSRPKTTNWEGNMAENRLIRRWLEKHAQRLDGFGFWQRLAGTAVRPNSIFRS
jgi:hypothetical protein